MRLPKTSRIDFPFKPIPILLTLGLLPLTIFFLTTERWHYAILPTYPRLRQAIPD